jgi:hypothetical protein
MQDKSTCKTTVLRLLVGENGQVLPFLALMIVMLLGVAALAVDLGRGYLAQRQLQASVNAAAIAAAETLPASTYVTVGQSFGSGSNEKNDYMGLTGSTPTVTGECLTTVEGWGVPCSSSTPNAVQVTETGSVQTYFARFLGFPTLNVTATATAATRGAIPLPYNVAIIVDSTLSMNTTDSNCGNITQMQCALNGVQELLLNLSPSVDHVSLFTFPNVAATASTAGIVVSGTYNCTSALPSNDASGQQSGIGYYVILTTQPYSGMAWAMPYTFPPAPTGTSGYAPPSGSYGPTYQVVPFSEDYRSSNTATSLNSSSNLVKAAGGVSGCGGIAPSNYDGDYGTYYAGAIYAAQAALLAEQHANPGTQNVMVILGDGNSDGPSSSSSPDSSSPSISSSSSQMTTTYSSSSWGNQTSGMYTYPSSYLYASSSGSYPSWVGECGQAVVAAHYAATYTNNPTTIYTIAYGASTQSSSGSNGNCSTDVNAGSYPNISPCTTLKDMASSTSNFYSDYYAPGGDSGCQAPDENNTITSLNQIFKAIALDLTSVRLIPNNTQ